MAFSTDGRFFLAADADGRLDLWAADTGNFLGTMSANEPIAGVRLFDGTITVGDGARRLGDRRPSQGLAPGPAQSGRPLPCFEKAIPPRIIPRVAQLDRDGQRLLVAGRSPSLPFQHVPSALAGTLAEMDATAWRYFFRIRREGDGSSFLQAWSLATGACLHTYAAVAGDIHCLAVSPDNTCILAACTDGSLHAFAMPEA